MDFRLNIRELMKVKKVTIEEVAKFTGKSRNTIHNYLNGKTPFDVDILISIAKILKVTPAELLLPKPIISMDTFEKLKNDIVKMAIKGNGLIYLEYDFARDEFISEYRPLKKQLNKKDYNVLYVDKLFESIQKEMEQDKNGWIEIDNNN